MRMTLQVTQERACSMLLRDDRWPIAMQAGVRLCAVAGTACLPCVRYSWKSTVEHVVEDEMFSCFFV